MYLAVRPREAHPDAPPQPTRIDAAEWRWVAALATLVLLLMAIPYAVALLRPPDGYLLAKSLFYAVDLPNYLAAVGDGRSSSSWLVQNHFTSESHHPAFMFPLYVLLGKLSAPLGLQPEAAVAAAMVLAAVALVFSGYAFIAAFIDTVRERRVAVLFLLFASGLGIWVAAATAPPAGSTESVTRGFSFDRAEVSTYLLVFGPPHLTMALALILLWGRALAEWTRCGRATSLVHLALAALGVGLLNSFSLVSLVAVAGTYTLVRWVSSPYSPLTPLMARWGHAATGARPHDDPLPKGEGEVAAPGRWRSLPVREAAAALLVAAVLAPLLAYSLLTFALDPFWATVYNSQNAVYSAPLWMLGFDFGVLLPLALVGVAAGKERPKSRLLLAVWVLTLLALIYLPVTFQRRFGYGLQPVLAVLAAMGAGRVGGLLRAAPARARWRLPAVAAVSTLAFGATFLGFAVLIMAARGVGGLGQTIYEPLPNFTASDWLIRHSGPADVVLSTAETGLFLGGRIRGRVMVGHLGVTLDPRRKEALARRFFSPGTTAEERRRIVAEEGVTHVFLGKRERAMGGAPLLVEEGFRLVYDDGEVRIYRVEGSSARLPSS